MPPAHDASPQDNASSHQEGHRQRLRDRTQRQGDDQGEIANKHHAILAFLGPATEAPPGAAALLRQVAVEELDIEHNEMGNPVDMVLAQLVRTAARAGLVGLQAEVRRGEVDPVEGSRQVTEVQRWLSQLDDDLLHFEAETALVGWLSKRGGSGDG